MSVFATAMTALDEATAVHALSEINRMKEERSMDDVAVAQSIIGALRELGKLGASEGSPDYDNEWVPPFYALWYQNSHVQMAYYLVKAIPSPANPFLASGPESIHLADFACGTMAMQFAAAVAAAERLEGDQVTLQVHMQSTDSSNVMWAYGKGLWKAFYDHLRLLNTDEFVEHILSACQIDRFHFVSGFSPNSTATHWLTALHAAYNDEENDVADQLGRRVQWYRPRMIAITVHQRRLDLGQAYVPPSSQYDDISQASFGKRWALRPFASKVDAVRKQIFEERIRDAGGVSENDKAFAQYYLVNDSLHIQRRMPQDTARMLYVRKGE